MTVIKHGSPLPPSLPPFLPVTQKIPIVIVSFRLDRVAPPLSTPSREHPVWGLNVKRGNGHERGLRLSRSVGQKKKNRGGVGRGRHGGKQVFFFFSFLAEILSGSYYRELKREYNMKSIWDAFSKLPFRCLLMRWTMPFLPASTARLPACLVSLCQRRRNNPLTHICDLLF